MAGITCGMDLHAAYRPLIEGGKYAEAYDLLDSHPKGLRGLNWFYEMSARSSDLDVLMNELLTPEELASKKDVDQRSWMMLEGFMRGRDSEDKGLSEKVSSRTEK